MNKYITMLLLGVVAIAMLLIIFVHTGTTPTKEVPVEAPFSESASPEASAVPAETPDAQAQGVGPEFAPDGPGGPGAEAENGAEVESAPQSTAGAGATPGSSATGPSTSTPPAAGQVTPPAGEQRGMGPAPASVNVGQGSIKDLSLHFRGNGMVLRVEGDSPLPAKYFILSEPERLVLDLPGSWKGLKAPSIPSNTLVKSARLGRQGNADRLVLDLQRPLRKHGINRLSDKSVEVFFE